MEKNCTGQGMSKIKYQNFIRIMKITLTLLFLCVTGLFASELKSQMARVNISMKNVIMRTVLDEIERQTDYLFLFSPEDVDMGRKTSVVAKNQPVAQVLSSIFRDTDISYAMEGNTIFLMKGNSIDIVETLQNNRVPIKGTVTDTSGEPVTGANVVEKGTLNGIMTDIDGKFTLEIEPNGVLQISYIGYITQEIIVKDQQDIKVILLEDTKALEEIVVIGYGVQKKVNLTGAVSMVKIDETLSSRSITNVSSGLSGLIPGLSVRQATGMAGQDGSTLQIRGLGSTNNSSPLIVVDGMPDININDLNMSDIESISVLKDAASAAVYGSRAANGVVLITTKRGQEGKLSVNYSGSYAWTNLVNFYDYMPDYPRMMDFHNVSYLNAGQSQRFTWGTIEQWMAMENVDPVLFPATDWWNVIFRNGNTRNHTISANAGTNRFNVYLSVGILDNSGVSLNTGYDRKNFRVNVDYKIRDYIKVGTSIDGMWSYMQNPKDGGINTTSDGSNGDVTKIIPGVTPISPDGRYGSAQMAYMENSTSSGNQYAVLANNFRNFDQQRISGNIFGEWLPLKGLVLRFEYGLNYMTQFQQTYSKPYLMWNFQINEPVNVITTNGGISNRYDTRYKTLLQGRTTYNTKLFDNQHQLTALVVYTEEYWFERWLSGSRQDRIHPDLTELNAALTDRPAADGNSAAEGLRSVIGRVNYDMYDKYLLEFTMRGDASSKFLKGHQWGIFPSVSLGWRFSNEPFFEPLKRFFQNAKLRGSWGRLGNNAGVGRYEQRDTYALTHYTFGGALSNGLSSNKMVNEDFSWESTAVTNLGLDLALLNGRLTTEIDVYNRLTSGLIRPMEISTLLSGYSAPRNNMGELQNRGMEINIGWQDNIGDFNYGVNFNYSYNKNKLLSWSQRLGFGENFIGYPWQFTYTYKATGIAQSWDDISDAPYQGSDKMAPGDILYEDLNGDGQITDSDRVAMPNSPRGYFNSNYGLTLFFHWKGIDFNTLFQASTGSKDFWIENFNRVYVNTSRNAYSTLHIDHWTLDNRDAALPRLVNGSTSNGGRNNLSSTFWLYPRDYLRFKNLQIGYNIPKNILQRVKIENLRLYISGENLLTWTMWPGIDPEKPGGIAANNQDLYPLTRSYSAGINLVF
jgi:TonB-linked SusC/RagA family outer membrane protein